MVAALILSQWASGQTVTVTNVFEHHYRTYYDFTPTGAPASATSCTGITKFPTGQYPSTYHLEGGAYLHHYDPMNASNDYYVFWSHFENSNYTTAEVAVFKSSSSCGPFILQTNLYSGTAPSGTTDAGSNYNPDGNGYGFAPGGWQSRDSIVFQDDSTTQTYNADGSVAHYADAYLYSASNSLNTAPTASGSTCSYTNDSIAGFRISQDYLHIDTSTSPNTNGANWIIPCTQHEGPVIVKKSPYYFLVTSQAAGFYPSQDGYVSSTNPLTGFQGVSLNLGNTSTWGGQPAGVSTITGTQATTYFLSLNHLGGSDTKNPAVTGTGNDSGSLFLPLILDSTAGTASLPWSPSWSVDATTGVLTLPTMVNLATSATATSTVTSAATSGSNVYTPGSAIDGNYLTRWAGSASGASSFNAAVPTGTALCPITNATSSTACNPSLIVDLGSVQPVEELDLSFYMVKGSEAYITFKIAYSNDNSTWTTIDTSAFASAANATTIGAGAIPFVTPITYGFNFIPVNFSARYVALIETSAVQQNSTSTFYAPNSYEMAVIKSTAPAVPQTPTITVTPSSSTVGASNAFSVAVNVAGPSGQPTPSGWIQLSANNFISDPYGLNQGRNTISIPAGSLQGGSQTLTVLYRADPTSAPIYGIANFTGTGQVYVDVPAAPTNLTVTPVSPGALGLTFTAAKGASSYVVYRSVDNGTTYTQAGTSATASFTDTGLTNGQTYCYEVASANAAGTGAPGGAFCAAASNNFPVSGLSVTQTGVQQLTIAYSASANATGYTIKRSVAGGAYSTLTSTTATSYVDSGLTNGTAYCYTVAAVFSTGSGADSSPVCVTVSAAIAAVTIANYSFETPTQTNYTYAPTGSSWSWSTSGSSIGSGIALYNGTTFKATSTSAPQGSQVAFFQKNVFASQVITGLTIGQTYRVTTALAQRQNAPSGQVANPMEYRIDGTAIATFTPAQSSGVFTDYSATFTATSSSHTLTFAATNALMTGTYPNNTVLMDNVRMISYPPAASTSSTPNYLWLVNSTGTLVRTDEQGAVQASGVGTTGSASAFGGVAIDANGAVWSVTSANNTLNVSNRTGTSPAIYASSSLNAPSSVAIDGAGIIWVTNSGSTGVTSFTPTGVVRSTVVDSTLNGQSGVAIDQAGSIWVSNSQGNTIDEIIGGAAPASPLSAAATANSPGTRP